MDTSTEISPQFAFSTNRSYAVFFRSGKLIYSCEKNNNNNNKKNYFQFIRKNEKSEMLPSETKNTLQKKKMWVSVLLRLFISSNEFCNTAYAL